MVEPGAERRVFLFAFPDADRRCRSQVNALSKAVFRIVAL